MVVVKLGNDCSPVVVGGLLLLLLLLLNLPC